MMSPTPPLRDVDSFETMTERFIKSTYHYLPVVDGEERLKGIVALQDLKEYLTMGDHLTSVIAMDVMRPPPQVLTPNQRLDEAMSILLSSEMRNVPVVNRLNEMKFIGVVVRY
ncbi:CBS domain-containing protein [bacterium]|nr:CBS domain-containing protein [bacterium]